MSGHTASRLRSPEQFRNSLATLKGQFESGAARFPDLVHRYIEVSNKSRDQSLGPQEPGRRPDDATATSGGVLTYAVRRIRADERGSERCTVNLLPSRLYFGAYFGDGAVAFKRLADAAAPILLEFPIALPLPEEIRAQLEAALPGIIQIVPLGKVGSDAWVRFLHALGWSKGHFLLDVERLTWVRNTRLPYDPDQLEQLRSTPIKLPGMDELARMESLPDYFFSDLKNPFLCSVWGIDWLLECLADARTEPESADEGTNEGRDTEARNPRVVPAPGEGPPPSPANRPGDDAPREAGTPLPGPGRARPARNYSRGELDARATAELVNNPRLTNKQIAAILNCNPNSLKSKKLKSFRASRQELKSGRESYRDADVIDERKRDAG